MLENLTGPSDLKKLPLEDLPALAREIRENMIAAVSKSGGVEFIRVTI